MARRGPKSPPARYAWAAAVIVGAAVIICFFSLSIRPRGADFIVGSYPEIDLSAF